MVLKANTLNFHAYRNNLYPILCQKQNKSSLYIVQNLLIFFDLGLFSHISIFSTVYCFKKIHVYRILEMLSRTLHVINDT